MDVPPNHTSGASPAPLPLSEANARALIDSVLDYGILMLDRDGTVLSWNAGAERLLGYRADEVIGRHFGLFYTADDLAAHRPEQELRTAAESGQFKEEGWRVRKDGTLFRAHMAVTALRDEAGELDGFAKVTHDVTERWQAEQALRQSEERFRILVEQIHDYAIFLLDPSGRITTWNAGAERIKGYQASEVLGRHVELFYTPEDQALHKPLRLLQLADRQGVTHDIGWRVRKDGSRFWADVTITELRDGNGQLYGFAKVVRDLTERVEAEETARAYEAAREAVRVRDEFLSIAAHELRTPLTATLLQLKGLERLLKRGNGPCEREPITTRLALAIESGERIAELIENLLDVSRIATGRIRLNLGDFDLSDAVHSVLARMQGLLQDSSCEVVQRLQPGITGRWDRLRLEQALVNLLANACKYAPQSEIEVGLARQGDGVRLWVKDQGPGIAAEHLERIFRRFERAVSVAHYGGLGLGLYVTQQIAELHGGRIQVDSRPGEGSTFTILLPLCTAETNADAPAD